MPRIVNIYQWIALLLPILGCFLAENNSTRLTHAVTHNNKHHFQLLRTTLENHSMAATYNRYMQSTNKYWQYTIHKHTADLTEQDKKRPCTKAFILIRF